MSDGVPAMHVLYVSHTNGVHDDRWIEAMRSSGCTVTPLRVDPEGREAHSRVMSLTTELGVDIIVAGPLTTCTSHLVGLDVPLVGLSWGFDLHEMADDESNSDLSWMVGLAGLIVDSEPTRSIAEDLGVSRDRIELIPWGVDLDLFDPAGPRAEHPGLPMNSRVVLSARSHEPLYRVGDIVTAFERTRSLMNDDVYLVVLNDGPLTEEMRAGAGDHTLFLGRVSESELAAWLRRSDLYVSASETDGSSVTLLQAMACGTPVLVSDIPGNREWVHAGLTGGIFPLSDVGALKQALTTALSDADVDESIDQAMAQVRSRADWSGNSPRLTSLLRRVSVA
ncbi:MAG: glycosyltransferase [Candidatus Nanopelagicales bacterium]|nr:glycosyltransferase [Candidatus Nanopelagicales bacterium]